MEEIIECFWTVSNKQWFAADKQGHCFTVLVFFALFVIFGLFLGTQFTPFRDRFLQSLFFFLFFFLTIQQHDSLLWFSRLRMCEFGQSPKIREGMKSMLRIFPSIFTGEFLKTPRDLNNGVERSKTVRKKNNYTEDQTTANINVLEPNVQNTWDGM